MERNARIASTRHQSIKLGVNLFKTKLLDQVCRPDLFNLLITSSPFSQIVPLMEPLIGNVAVIVLFEGLELLRPVVVTIVNHVLADIQLDGYREAMHDGIFCPPTGICEPLGPQL